MLERCTHYSYCHPQGKWFVEVDTAITCRYISKMSGDTFFRELDNNFINFDEVGLVMHKLLLLISCLQELTETYNYMSTDTVVHWNWKLDIPISTPGSIVSYTFSTKGGDISFGIAFAGCDDGAEEEDVLEEHRVPSDIEPISGAFKAPCEGSVCLYWDNSFSWLTPKKLSYSVEVRQVSTHPDTPHIH